MSTLKPIKSAYPTGSQFLPFFFLNPKGVKSRSILEIAKLLLITSVLLLGYNLSFAQPGSLDTSFDPGMGADQYGIATISLQSDGKIIIGGGFSSYDGLNRNGIARLHPDGSLDFSFDPGAGINQEIISEVKAIYIQNDGKIIIGGPFYLYNGTEINGIARLHPDGSLDDSFDPGTGVNHFGATSISLQSDEKIIIGGIFSLYNGTEINGIARLHPDGGLDTSFDTNIMREGNSVESISLQSDGKILLGGDLKTYFREGRHHLIRLHPDGTLDTLFDPATISSSWVHTTILQNDGKIIILGHLLPYNGQEVKTKKIVRLNQDGSLDTSFDSGTGADDWIYAAALQGDGKIVISGLFNSYNGVERNGIARLHPDGSLDTSFDPELGVHGLASSISLQSDEKIIIAGGFTSYDGTPINRIARLFSTTSTSVNPPLEEESKIVKIFPNPFSNVTTLHSEIQLKNANLTIFNSIGQTVKQITAINIGAGNNFTLNRDHLPTGLYFIQLSQDNQVIMNDKLVITD